MACGGYLVHPFANQIDLLLIASCFSGLWHSQMKEYKSIARVYLYHAEHTLFIFFTLSHLHLQEVVACSIVLLVTIF